MRYFALTLIFTLPIRLLAQCCSGGVPMSNNIGLPTADKGSLQVNVNYDWNNLKTLKVESRLLEDANRQRETHSLLLELGYTISDRLSIDLFIPTVRQERTITTVAGSENFVFTQGLGDIVILPKYTLNKLTVGLGLKVPTGASNNTSPGGIPLVADLQPGSGAVDGIIYLSYQRYSSNRPSFGYFGNVIYRNTGTNNAYFNGSSYEFGDEMQLILGVADRFSIKSLIIDPSLKLRYRTAGRDFFDGGEFPSSGGQFLFVNPGITVALSQKFSWQVNTSLPIYTFVNDTQLSPTIQINTGILFKTNITKNLF